MAENLKARGIEFILSAQRCEENKDLPSAINDYRSGIEYLMTAMKYERNETAKEIVHGRIKAYQERVEQLQQMLDTHSAAPEEPIGITSSTRVDNEIKQRATELIVSSSSSNVKWTDIAGLDDVKESLKQAIVYPIKMPQLFSSGRVEPWSGILLYGSPGTGKTLIAKAVANEAGAKTFMHVSVAGIMGKYVGESERMVAAIFRIARENAPTVIFIDEVDCIASERKESEHEVARKVKNQLLLEMDGVGSGLQRVLVLAATNMPWLLDAAFLRRMQKRIHVPLPDMTTRRTIILHELSKMASHSLTDEQINQIAQTTEHWSGSDISTLIKTARNNQMTELSKATHFCTVGKGATQTITMCSSDTIGAKQAKLDDLISGGLANNIVLPDVSYNDFCVALVTTHPACNSSSNLEQFNQFSKSQGSG